MSREKQIEEIYKVIMEAELRFPKANLPLLDIERYVAEAIYNASYRKVILCNNCKFCEHRYPVKEIGEEAKESWYCNVNWRYVRPEGYCNFAEMKGD